MGNSNRGFQMEKQKLIITKGLPASGKTTWAREQVVKGQGQIKRVNKDDFRDMVDCSKHSKGREREIIDMQDTLINCYLSMGYSVIVDNTNFGWEDHFREMIQGTEAEFEIKDFTHVPLEECLRRNEQRGLKVPQKAIKDMFNKYVRKAPVYTDSHYIICDIDGTLAHMEGRSPYDGTKVHTDKVDTVIKALLQILYGVESKIIIVSARDGKYFDVTKKWLDDNEVPYDDIVMRTTGDNREDSIVKQEILEELIINEGCKPFFVLDDRDRVVDMWRRNGIKCLQVEPGDF